MGKKNKKGASYKPAPQQVSFKPIQKAAPTMSKAERLLENASTKKGGDVFKSELKVTDEMFEAAKLMKGGVAHIKDLDMSVLSAAQPKPNKQHSFTAQVTLIDIFTGDSKTTTVPLTKDDLSFDFNSEKHFNADADSRVVAKKAWDWLLNPVGIERFKSEIKDKKIMIIQNRSGFTYK
jgi:hypothetical protein